MAGRQERSSARRRAAAAITAGVLLIGLSVVVVVTHWAGDSVIHASITLSADGAPPVVLTEESHRFASSRPPDPITTYEFDLDRWAGELVRLDFEGHVSQTKSPFSPTGSVGWHAELVNGSEVTPIEFIGWQNEDGFAALHPGTVGSPAFAVPGRRDLELAYSAAGSLWHVLRVPEDTRLRIQLTPLLGEHNGGAPDPVRPRTARLERTSSVGRAGTRRSSGPKYDVFIFLIDALGADHLGCYGYSRSTSPAIDAFASEATLYERAYTPATWTRPAVVSMMTGLYPSVHGAMYKRPERLADWPVLLPEILRDAGYKTFCATANVQVSPSFGVNRGYDEYVYEYLGSAQWLNSAADEFLQEQEQDQPVFLLLHLMEPHIPYEPTPESLRSFDRGFEGRYDGTMDGMRAAGWIRPRLRREDREHLIDLYDGCIRDADSAFAEFLGILRGHGRLENALVIVLADHGEAFGEHDTLTHGRSLNQEEMHIPLIIRFPGRRFAGVRVAERATLIDVVPTILSVLDVRPQLDYSLPGEDLSGPDLVSRSPPRRRVYGEVSMYDDNQLDLVCAIDEDGYKRVIDMSSRPGAVSAAASLGLWATEGDPAEATSLLDAQRVRAFYGEQLIARWLAAQQSWRPSSAAPQPAVGITEDTRRQMEALGYLD